MDTHLHFSISRASLDDRILIPKYYDPDLGAAERLARTRFDIYTLGELLLPGRKGSQLGVWLPRDTYGSGEVPYVRTSDLFHWRIRPDFKKGVSPEVLERYRHRIDVGPNDILMVAHGTYLVGDVAIVREGDLPLLVQDHVFRLRLRPDNDFHPHVVLAALSTQFVRRQVRARQFSAEIIDKLGNRHLGILVPIPRDRGIREKIATAVAGVIERHAAVRSEIGRIGSADRVPGPRPVTHFGFSVNRGELINRVLIPRYYDPDLNADISTEEGRSGKKWTTIEDLVVGGLLELSTGVEVGKMAYGTGSVPFVRTSDLVDWEVRRDPTHGVDEAIYRLYDGKGSLQVDDVVLVRDGTYLVGSSALVMQEDLPALYCGGIFRFRATKKSVLSPHALLGLLNLPLVRRQLRCKQFTRDVIDTLGQRVLEVRVPVPDSETVRVIQKHVEAVMKKKAEIKGGMDEAIGLLEAALPSSASGRPGWSMR